LSVSPSSPRTRPTAGEESPRMAPGEVAEWSNAPHSKCGIGASLSGVRIPPSPPVSPSDCLWAGQDLEGQRDPFGDSLESRAQPRFAFVSAPLTPARYRAQPHWYRSTTRASWIWILGRANRISARSKWSRLRSSEILQHSLAPVPKRIDEERKRGDDCRRLGR
jgi:hypothetical protein